LLINAQCVVFGRRAGKNAAIVGEQADSSLVSNSAVTRKREYIDANGESHKCGTV
jgi:hypothetical protein